MTLPFPLSLAPAWVVVQRTADIAATTYIFILSALYLFNRSTKLHKTLTETICAISALSFVHWYLASLGQYLALNYSPVEPHWSAYTALALSFVQTSLALVIPVGPKLYQDMSKLYNKAVTAKLKEEVDPSAEHSNSRLKANVNEEVSSSIISKLMFGFAYPMISKTSSMEQVDMADLPVAHAYFRTQNILHDVVSTNDVGGMKTKNPGSTFGLLWTIWSPEWRSLLAC
jgi:hypothetical protein